jgi:hypothetical protein
MPQTGLAGVVGFDAGSGVGGSGSRRWNTRRGSDHATVLADLDPEPHRLPLGIQRACSMKENLGSG